MSRPLYSGCEQDTVACERTWSESASWTLHSAIAKKQNRRSTTSSRTVPSGGNRDTSYGRRVSQPLTSCGERRKTCAAPPSSWQHVDWGSKHGWSTAEEEEELKAVHTLISNLHSLCGMVRYRTLRVNMYTGVWDPLVPGSKMWIDLCGFASNTTSPKCEEKTSMTVSLAHLHAVQQILYHSMLLQSYWKSA